MKILFLPIFSLVALTVIVASLPALAQQPVRSNVPTTADPAPATLDPETRHFASPEIRRPGRITTDAERQRATEAKNAFLNARRAADQTQRIELGRAMLTEQVQVRALATRRLETLLTTGNCSLLSAKYKDPIKAELSKVIADLDNQRNAIEAVNSVEQIRTTYRAILENNQVFRIIVPAVRGACASGRLIERVANVIETRLADLPTTEENTELKQRLATAIERAEGAYLKFVQALANRHQARSPEPLKEAREELRAAIQQLRDATTRPVRDNITPPVTDNVEPPLTTRPGITR